MGALPAGRQGIESIKDSLSVIRCLSLQRLLRRVQDYTLLPDIVLYLAFLAMTH
jgi:hypothetical protein